MLGTWQYQRLNWKNNLIKNIEQSVNNPFSFNTNIIYPELTSIILPDSYRTQNNPIFIGYKTYKGNNGFHLYFPIFKDNDFITVLNAGWIKNKDKKNTSNIFNKISNKKYYRAYIRNFYKEKPYFTPQNNLNKNEWFYPDHLDLENYYSKKIQLDQYFVLAEVSVNKYFVNPMTLMRNSHLQYLLTWYLLSLTSLVMLILCRRKKNG